MKEERRETAEKISYVDETWYRSTWRPFLIALTATAVGVAPVLLALRLAPHLPLRWVIPFFFVIALEGVATTRWLGYPDHRQARTLSFRLGEFVFLAGLLRLFTWATISGWPDMTTVYRWLLEPTSFFDLAFVFLLIMLVLVWSQAMSMTGIFGRIALQPDELAPPPYTSQDPWAERAPPYESRSVMVKRLAGRWVWGALILVLLAGLSQLTVTRGTGLRVGLRKTGLPPEYLLLVLVYLFSGLILISEGQLGALRARWHIEGTRWDEAIHRRWVRITLTTLAVAGLIAALMPLGSTFTLGAMVEWVLLALLQVGYFLLLLSLSFFSLLLSALGFTITLRQSAPVEPAQNLAKAEQTTRGLLPPWLGGALVWVGILVLLIFVLRAYLNERGLPLTWRSLWRLWLEFLAWWRTRQRRLFSARKGTRLPPSRSEEEKRAFTLPQLPLVFWRLRRLSPTQQVRYYYFAALHRARRAGVPRRVTQTPLEYARDLEAQVPEAEADAETLTRAFIAVRYAGREFHPQEVGWVRRAWEHFRRVLRPRRR